MPSTHQLRRRRNFICGLPQHHWAKAHIICAKHNLVLCPPVRNGVRARHEMMLTAGGQTMLCPADTNTKEQVFRLALLMVGGTGQSRYASLLLDDRRAVPVSHHYAKKQPFEVVFLNASCLLEVRALLCKRKKQVFRLALVVGGTGLEPVTLCL